MTPEQLNEARAVAGKLTEAQRRKLRNSLWSDRASGFITGDQSPPLTRMGLLHPKSTRLTPFGLTVRRVLQEHPNG